MVVRRSPAPGDRGKRRRAPRPPDSGRSGSGQSGSGQSGSGRIVRGFAAAGLLAGLAAGGCNTSTTATLPTPDFRAAAGASFPLRAGDLGLVVGSTNYLFVSLSSVGLDTRCPPAETCDSPGFLDLDLDLETRDNLGSLRLRVPESGESVGTHGAFEIRTHRVEPAGRRGPIPVTDYVVEMSVRERADPPAGE